MIRKLLSHPAVVSLAISLAFAGAASAQEYPTKPVRVVVPFAAGGGAPDVAGRLIAQGLTSQLGQQFIVDNRAGANGIIGTEAVVKSSPDGYTILVVSASIVVNPSIYRKLPYDTFRDLVPVTTVCDVEALIFAVHPSVPAQTLQEFIAYARKPESRVSFGSPGHGNTLHLAAELFNVRAGLKMVHVPFKGSAPALAALLASDIQAMFLTPPQGIPMVQSGKLRGLGYTNKTRASALPNLPTMAEAGVQGMEFDGGWFGMFAPAKTPPAIVSRLQRAARDALNTPEIRERLAGFGMRGVGDEPAEFAKFVQAQVRMYADIVKAANIQPE